MPFKDAEHAKKYSQQYYRDNKERIKDRAKKWAAVHREEANESSRLWRVQHRATWNRWKNGNKEHYNESVRLRLRRVRLMVLSHYSGGVPNCACCGESHVEFLTMDHINGGGAEHRRVMKNSNIYIELKRLGFPVGFRVLCSNCNHAHGCYGYCPHE
jgi:hypothetical protein